MSDSEPLALNAPAECVAYLTHGVRQPQCLCGKCSPYVFFSRRTACRSYLQHYTRLLAAIPRNEDVPGVHQRLLRECNCLEYMVAHQLQLLPTDARELVPIIAQLWELGTGSVDLAEARAVALKLTSLRSQI